MSVKHEFKDTTGGFLGLQNLSKFSSNPFDFLFGLIEEQGDIAFFKFGPVADIYLVSNPDYIRDILVKHWEKTVKWERMADVLRTVSPHAITIQEGDIWRKHRKLLTPAFHTQRIKTYVDLMASHSLKMLNQWQDNQVYEMNQAMTQVTLGIIGEILFDIADIERDAAKLTQAFEVLLAQFLVDVSSLIVLPKWLPTKRHKRELQAKENMNVYIDERIQIRRNEGADHGDVLSALLFTKDAETGAIMSNEEVRDELYGLLFAGHETTALLITWALYALAKKPEIQAELFQEIHTVLGEKPVTLDNLDKLELTERVLKETLRMYPPAWSLLFRRAIEDIHLGETVIPKGGVVYISPYVQQHLLQYWDNPDVFDPSRFEGDWKSKIPNYTYMPFGGGPRVCIGSHLAEMEAKVILTSIIKAFSIELPDPETEIYRNAGFTLRPYPNMQLKVRKR